MSKRRRDAVTFEGLLERVAPDNQRRLMQRARTANRLAKSVDGRARRLAYRVKTDALINLKRHFPDDVVLRCDFRHPTMVVVAVSSVRFGLHAPAREFTVGEGL